MTTTIAELEHRFAVVPQYPTVYVWPQDAIQWAEDSLELHRAQAAEIASLHDRVDKLTAQLQARYADY